MRVYRDANARAVERASGWPCPLLCFPASRQIIGARYVAHALECPGMEESAFDRLVRTFATEGTRRRLLGLLTGLPLAGLLPGSDVSEARPGRKAHRHRATHQHRHAKTQRRKDDRDETRAEACIPTGQRCPSKKVRGKKHKKLGCTQCCQGASHTESDGKQYCGCQPNGGSCTAATASSCCSGFCDGATCQIPSSAPCERTCTTTCCNAQCCPDPAAICHVTTGTCCVPDSLAITCTGRCGEVVNNCGQLVTCAPCTCDPACEFCQLCNETTDTCEADPAKNGMSCGACQQCAGGTCQACADECCQNQCCSDPAAICHVTNGTCCVPEDPAVTCGSQTCGTAINNCGQEVPCTGCTGCCDGDTCVAVADQTNQGCGTDGDTCTNCLSSNGLCRSGTCQACDVCPSGACDFTSVQAAINASSPQLSTILVCPGTYLENGGSLGGVEITRPLSLIGAGMVLARPPIPSSSRRWATRVWCLLATPQGWPCGGCGSRVAAAPMALVSGSTMLARR